MTLATGTWPGFVARVATPATPAETAQIIVDAWPAEVGTEASSGELEACLAQVMLETGERQGPDAAHQAPGYWNGNAGNVRGTYEGAWTSFAAGEGHGASAVTLAPGPANRFRSYLSATDDSADPATLRAARIRGIRDYIALLVRKYPKALARAAVRDFAGFVHELHAGGYFTAAEDAYAAAEDRLRLTIEVLPLVRAYLSDAI